MLSLIIQQEQWRMKHSRACAILVAVACVLPLTGIIVAPSSSAATLKNCPKFTVVALRGNGEMFNSSTLVKQVGGEAATIYERMAVTAPFKGNLGYSGVPRYMPTAQAYGFGYLDELGKAGTTLTSYLPAYDKSLACKSPTSYVLIGYSQGAYEVRSGLAALSRMKSAAPLVSRAKAVVLIGDPAQASTGLLRVNSNATVSTSRRDLLNDSVNLCIDIDNKNWPFPDCAVSATANAFVYDLVSHWKGLGASSIVGLPKQPTYSYVLPGDGIARGTAVLNDEYIPSVQTAKRILASSQTSKYGKAVAVLQEAYQQLDVARTAHKRYSADSKMPAAVVAWLAKTVK